MERWGQHDSGSDYDRISMSYLNFVQSLLCTLLICSATNAVTMDTVPVGNPGNIGDVQSQGTFGRSRLSLPHW